MATKAQITIIYTLIRNGGMADNKEDLVSQFSNNRTTHVSELSVIEADNMAKYLKKDTVPYKPKNSTDKATKRGVNSDIRAVKMRKKILHILALNGFLTEGQTFDYKRIEAFIKDIGSRNPHKVGINYLTNDELVGIVTQIECMVFKKF
jgi:hypothetical protein